MTNSFDAIHPWGTDSRHGNLGLTKREYFAAAILNGLLTSPGGLVTPKVELTIELTDALIKALNQ